MTATPTTDNEPKIKKSKKKLIVILSVILGVILVFVSAFLITLKIGEMKLRKNLVANEKIENSEDGLDDTAVYHNGKAYYYNENLINLLLIGVDRESNSTSKNGQADALYLVSVDTKQSKVKIVGISRNTLCKMDVYGSDGKPYGTENAQICLAYAYGNDDITSSENCVSAVSNLLFDIPVNGYYTIYFDSLSKIVNMVGGVRVTVPTDTMDPQFANTKGKSAVLDGTQAISFLRTRNDSNAPRVERHKAFISGFINAAKSAVKKDLSLPVKIANKLSNESVTNIDISGMLYLATEALNWEIEFINISGEYSIENDLEIFTVDEENLKDTVIGNFYIAEK